MPQGMGVQVPPRALDFLCLPGRLLQSGDKKVLPQSSCRKRPMWFCLAPLAFFCALASGLSQPVTLKTKAGAVYADATLSRIEPDGLVLVTDRGIKKVFFTEMNREDQQRYGYDPGAALEFSTRQREAQRAHNVEAEKHQSAHELNAYALRKETADRLNRLQEIAAKPPVRIYGRAQRLTAQGMVVECKPLSDLRLRALRAEEGRELAAKNNALQQNGKFGRKLTVRSAQSLPQVRVRPETFFEGKAVIEGKRQEFGLVDMDAKQIGLITIDGEELPVYREVVPKMNSLSGELEGWVLQ